MCERGSGRTAWAGVWAGVFLRAGAAAAGFRWGEKNEEGRARTLVPFSATTCTSSSAAAASAMVYRASMRKVDARSVVDRGQARQAQLAAFFDAAVAASIVSQGQRQRQRRAPLRAGDAHEGSRSAQDSVACRYSNVSKHRSLHCHGKVTRDVRHLNRRV